MVFQRTISELVDENYIYARALDYLGIDFFHSADRVLEEVCEEKKLDREIVIKTFYLFDTQSRVSFKELESYPIEILKEYLKHNHHSFIKDKLPFIVNLLHRSEADVALIHMLPEFIEDFIKHIYEEEDTIFRYIETLLRINANKIQSPPKALFEFEALSLSEEAEEHSNVDEFSAIRTLIANFAPANLIDEVLVKEIKGFDRELLYHSQIENHIFFPKAIELERTVHDRIKNLSKLN